MPDMYVSPSMEVYGTREIDGDTMYSTEFLPVKGTIARGYIPYAYPNTAQGYEQAGEQRKSGTTDGVPQMLVGVTLVSLEREGTENAPAVGQLLLNLDRWHVDN